MTKSSPQRAQRKAMERSVVQSVGNGTRTLVVGTIFSDNRFKVANAELWLDCLDQLSPGVDICLINSCSPINPMTFLERRGFGEHKLVDPNDNFDLPLSCGNRGMLTFTENIGRIETTGQDGPQQAFSRGMAMAIKGRYDYIAHIEADMVFMQPVMPIIDRMKKKNIKAACPFSYEYSFAETGALFMSVPWLKERDYFSAYDWRWPPVVQRIDPLPNGQMIVQRQFHERWFEGWCGEDLWILPLRGTRNDADKLTVNNFPFVFPHGVDFLTHCKDLEVYRRAMQANGLRA